MGQYNRDTNAEEIAADCRAQIEGKTIFITGVSPRGLGAGFALIVAKHGPACIILATRDLKKAEETAKEVAAVASSIRIRPIELNLTSLKQIRQAAEAINSLEESIDVFVNNAGIMAPPYSRTSDGIESQFGVNHVGHFLLTNLLLPKSLAIQKPIRVVNVASNGYRFGPVRLQDWNFDDGNTYERWTAYAQSKTANMLFTKSLAQKLERKGVTSVTLHPGVIQTQLARNLQMEDFGELAQIDKKLGYRDYWNQPFHFKTMSQGVATHVFAAFHPSLESPELNGSYLEDSNIVKPEKIMSWARDSVDAEQLWTLSEELVSQKFEY